DFKITTLHPPPKSTLFPYTTLFRSLEDAKAELEKKKDEKDKLYAQLEEEVHEHEELVMSLEEEQQLYASQEATLQKAIEEAKRKDRKSTRLNSSHVKISYAVFCLKK